MGSISFVISKNYVHLCVLLVILFTFSNCQDEGSAEQNTNTPPPPTLTSEQYLQEGDKSLKEGNIDLSIKHYTSAIKADPTAYLSYFKRAAVYLMKGKSNPALSDLNSLLDRNPTFSQGRIRRAKILLSFGRYDKARTDIEEILKEKPDHELKSSLPSIEKGEQLLKTAYAKFEEQKWEEARTLYSELLDISTDYVEGRLHRSTCNLELKEYNSVIEDTMRVLKLVPENIDGLYMRGKAFYGLGQNDAAQNHFREALRMDPDNKKCKVEYKKIKKLEKSLANGDQYLNEGKYKEALEEFESAQETDPDNKHLQPRYLLSQCKCKVKLNQAQEAITLCTKALEADETLVDALVNRAEAHLLKEDYDAAVADYSAAREKDSGNRGIQEGYNRAVKQQKMALRKDHYKILGVTKDASPSEIKKSYRKLALQYHPDKNQGADSELAEKKFIEVGEAYEILSDEEKKRKYDNGEDIEVQHGFDPFAHFHQQHGGGGGGYTFSFNFGGR